MMLSLPVLIVLLPSVGAMSWLYAPSWQKGSRAVEQTTENDLPPEELSAILQGSSSLAAYSSKPDCFRKAAALIQTRCGDLETNQSERVKAALAMTLCEIATAKHYSPPMECAAFQVDVDKPSSWTSDSEAPQNCVSALSRSAQYWSSYSGYLREVAQLCFALRRWNDIDTAKEIHRNATIEAVYVLRYMANREKQMQATWNESHVLLGTMQAILNEMYSSSAAIGLAADAAEMRYSSTLSEVTQALNSLIDEAHQRVVHEHQDIVSKLDASASEIITRLNAAFTGIASTLEQVLVGKMDASYAQVAHHLEKIDVLASRVGSKLVDVEQNVDTLQRVATDLVTDVKQAGTDMEVYLRNSQLTHEVQLETVKAAENVSSTLSDLVVKAHEGMQNLNGTIVEMQNSFVQDARSGWDTVWLLFQEGLVNFLRVQPEVFDHPFFHVCWTAFRVLRALGAFVSSGMMATFLLLTSVRDLVLHRLCAGGLSFGDSSSSVVLTRTRPAARNAVIRSPAPDVMPVDTDTSGLAHVGDGFSSGSSGHPYRRGARLSRIPDRLCGTRL